MERAINKWPEFSFFNKPSSNTYPSGIFTLLDTYNYIIGDKAKATTERLRTISDKDEAKQFKFNNFDFCTFSGTFSYRNAASLIQHSTLMTADLDDVEDVEKVRQQLLEDEYFDSQLLFVSPSGNGLKWVIEIDLSQASHADYFRAISNYLKQTYNLEVDKSGRDVCRACYLPYDPTCYINPKYLAI